LIDEDIQRSEDSVEFVCVCSFRSFQSFKDLSLKQHHLIVVVLNSLLGCTNGSWGHGVDESTNET
jgi:hypothetical protein